MRWRHQVLQILVYLLAMFCVQIAHAKAESLAPPLDFSFVEPYFENVGDLETLGDSVITALLQDDKGLLWIGTTKGLIQFDGYRFRRYTHNQRDPHSLVGEFILSLCLGRDGRLWIGTNSNGISAFNPNTERFENFRHDPNNPKTISAGRIWTLAAAADGGIWVGTDHGLGYLPKEGGEVQHFRHVPGQAGTLHDSRVRSLLLDPAGDLWIGLADGLQVLKKNTTQFVTVMPQIGTGLAGQEVRSLLQAQDGKLWIGTRKNGVAWLDIQRKSLHWLKVDASRADSLTHGWVKSMVQTENGRIWIGTVGGGINVVSASDGQILQRLRRDPSIASSLAVDDLGALLIDQAGLLWVGTWGGGLQRHHVGNQAIRIMRHSPSQAMGLSRAEVRSVLELANGQILAGTYGNGIDIIDRKRGVVGGIRPSPAGNLPSANIMSLVQTADGTLWAGSQQNGILRLPLGASQWQVWGTEHGLPGVQMRCFLIAKNGDLWAGTTDGVARLPFGAQRFETLLSVDGKPMRSAVEAMVEDKQGRIWLGSNAGLWLWQANLAGLQPHLNDSKRGSSLASDDVRGLLLDAHGDLWVGIPQGLDKLLSMNGGMAQFEHINMSQTQIMEPGENLLEDRAGRIWSNNFMYDPQRKRMNVLSKADGFDIGTAWLGAFTRTRDGLFLYGGTHGMAIIDPQRCQPWNYQPPFVVSELKINGKPNTALELSKELTLNPKRRSFSLEFAALDYSSPGKLRYSYRLQGYDREWIETDANHRVASYSNLWPGQYILQVRATNRLGQLSSKQLEIPVRVLPAFWQTGWFVVCAVLLSAGLVYGGYSWRVARMRANARHLQTLIDARTADILHLAEIGQDLTATLDTEQAFARVYQQVSSRLDAHVFSISLMNEDKSALVFVYEMENGARLPASSLMLDEIDRPAIWCVRHQRELIIGSCQELLNYVGNILPPAIGRQMETVVYLPLIVEQDVLGCLSVQSPKVNAYSRDHLEFLRVLASYTAIALANSGAHSRLSKAHAELAAAHLHLTQTQARLAHSEKMASLGGLVAGIAHEINTPLGTTLMAISGVSQALEELQRSVETGRVSRVQVDACIKDCIAYANLAAKTASRAANLIATFKTIAVSKDDGKLVQFGLRDYLEDLLYAVYRHLQPVGCSYQIEIADEIELRVLQSALQEALTRVLDNVLVHAFDAGRIGSLHIRAYVESGDTLLLTLQDNGHGIAEQNLAHVFDPFFTTKGGDQGHVGLGLHVAYNHVKQGLQGEISLSSRTAPDAQQGTCVTLRFARWQGSS